MTSLTSDLGLRSYGTNNLLPPGLDARLVVSELGQASPNLTKIYESYKKVFTRSPNPNVTSSVEKRQKEHLMGHLASYVACSELETNLDQVTYQKNRAPVFPKGLVGSVSHCDKYVASVVSRSCHLNSIGLDIEELVRDRESSLAFTDFATEQEDQALEEISLGIRRARRSLLIFSAKESIFKAFGSLGVIIEDPLDIEIQDFFFRPPNAIGMQFSVRGAAEPWGYGRLFFFDECVIAISWT